MNNEKIKSLNQIDDVAEKVGGYVDFSSNNNVHYDYRKMLKYCRDRGITPLDLTDREYNSFAII